MHHIFSIIVFAMTERSLITRLISILYPLPIFAVLLAVLRISIFAKMQIGEGFFSLRNAAQLHLVGIGPRYDSLITKVCFGIVKKRIELNDMCNIDNATFIGLKSF